MVNDVVWTSHLPEQEREMQAGVHKLLERVTDLAFDSIVYGSATTGAPGQPEDLRELKWWEKRVESDTSALIMTEEHSARSVEDGISYFNGKPIELKRPGGGFHSVALTKQNFDKLLAQAVNELGGRDA